MATKEKLEVNEKRFVKVPKYLMKMMKQAYSEKDLLELTEIIEGNREFTPLEKEYPPANKWLLLRVYDFSKDCNFVLNGTYIVPPHEISGLDEECFLTQTGETSTIAYLPLNKRGTSKPANISKREIYVVGWMPAPAFIFGRNAQQ